VDEFDNHDTGIGDVVVARAGVRWSLGEIALDALVASGDGFGCRLRSRPSESGNMEGDIPLDEVLCVGAGFFWWIFEEGYENRLVDQVLENGFLAGWLRR